MGTYDRARISGILLAAGRGTRLAPLTDVLAKPALPFLNLPIAFYALNTFRRAGIANVGINAFHRATDIFDLVARWRTEMGSAPELEVVTEAHLMGTGGGIRAVWDALLRPDTVVACNGDIVTSFDLEAALDTHVATGRGVTLVLDTAGEGGIRVEPNSLRIVEVPGPEHPWSVSPDGHPASYCGAAIIDAGVLERLPDAPGCLLRQGLGPLLEEGLEVWGHFTDGVHLDVGTPSRYWQAMRALLHQPLETGIRAANRDLGDLVDCKVSPPLLVHPDAFISEGCQLGPYVVIGAGVEVSRGSVIKHAVLHDTGRCGSVENELRVAGARLPFAAERLPSQGSAD